jgi:hypothetical protein
MLMAYINYPNHRITIHENARCTSVQQQRKSGQRVVRFDIESISRELGRFVTKEYTFGAQPDTNDMWLEVDFGNGVFETALVEYVRALLAQHYRPFAGVKLEGHC